jgi:predicted N-acetyltransferase YhbS
MRSFFLEVLPSRQGEGIGKELIGRLKKAGSLIYGRFDM